jgi:hypothetical protein
MQTLYPPRLHGVAYAPKQEAFCKESTVEGKIVTNAIVVGMFGGFVDGNKLQHFDKPSITSITRGMFHTE